MFILGIIKVAARLVTDLFRISTSRSFFLFCVPRMKQYMRQIRLRTPRASAVACNGCNPDAYLVKYRNRMVAVAVNAAPRHKLIIT